ncbi:periphilin-1 isoform X2 [Hippoglossus stenolepis]|uniref:periphilin-1 isoform X2 n=1 Tax=Hippoglossus stenolepis TaxID=195615 RepID=UPI001FAEEA5D|nr:periphilin-1 isoform X2 [Hippoglossus stenolepis]
MAYRHDRHSTRDKYEEPFPEMFSREVNYRRVVNVVEKRSIAPRPGLEYDRDFHDDQRYGGARNHQDAREYHEECSYPPEDCHYYDDNSNYDNFHRNSTPPRNEEPYSQQGYPRDDLRNNDRPAPYPRSRGRRARPARRQAVDKKPKGDPDDCLSSAPVTQHRSPVRREAQIPGCSGSNSRSSSFSPDKAKGSKAHQQAEQKNKPNVLATSTPSSPVEGSPHSSGSSKEKTASVVETQDVPAASMEPKPTPEDDAKTGRLKAIKEKALEIEKHYRQDCETFRTVVKMLVAKEPSLDNLLQAPLDKNLLEMKQRCLDALRHFVKELDEVLDQPDTSAKTTGHKTQEQHNVVEES